MGETKKILKGQSYSGEVVSVGNSSGTVIVKATWYVETNLYGKKVKKTSRIMAHDANGSCVVGDKVKINSTRPLSKRKKFIVVAKID
jgi:small subunit ribosomal protein S17